MNSPRAPTRDGDAVPPRSTAARHHDEPPSAVIWHWRPASADPAAPRRARVRGLVRALIALVVAALLVVWKPVLGAVAAGVALGLAAVALISPLGLYPKVERSITAFARAVGKGVGAGALLVLHLLVFSPLGLLLRSTGRLRFSRDPRPGASGYWRTPDGPADGSTGHERQF